MFISYFYNIHLYHNKKLCSPFFLQKLKSNKNTRNIVSGIQSICLVDELTVDNDNAIWFLAFVSKVYDSQDVFFTYKTYQVHQSFIPLSCNLWPQGGNLLPVENHWARDIQNTFRILLNFISLLQSPFLNENYI